MSGSRPRTRLAVTAVVRLVAGLVIVPAALFVPAGTTAYWQGWVYLAALFVPVTAAFLWLLVRRPDLLERRMRAHETRPTERLVLRVGILAYAFAFVIPGIDHRFGWSTVPVALVLAADALLLLAYGLFVLVMRENPFASRVIEVEREQRVITSGPYSVVRHPMYVATLLMFVATPVALGSWWALLTAVPLVAMFAIRIRDEEQLLVAELPGYREYTMVTRHRLVPGVW